MKGRLHIMCEDLLDDRWYYDMLRRFETEIWFYRLLRYWG